MGALRGALLAAGYHHHMTLLATRSVIHQGHQYEPGDELPDSVDGPRLIERGLAEDSKPRTRKPRGRDSVVPVLEGEE